MRDSVYNLNNHDLKIEEKKFRKSPIGQLFFSLKFSSFLFLIFIFLLVWYFIIKDSEVIVNNIFSVVIVLVLSTGLFFMMNVVYFRNLFNWYKDNHK